MQLLVILGILISIAIISGIPALIIGIIALNRLNQQSRKIHRLELQLKLSKDQSAEAAIVNKEQSPKPHSVTSVSTVKPGQWSDSQLKTKPVKKSYKTSGITKGCRWILNFFTSGNSFVRIGALILFLGVGFLLKYTASSDYLPVSYRLFCAGLGSAALMVLGWWLRNKRREYALSLQGTSFGLLYLLGFSIYYYFHYISAPMALGLVLVLSFALAVTSIIQNAKYLALISIIGAFISPLLIPFGMVEHPSLLFSYYLLINLAIFSIAWFKSWRELSLVGFIFTFALCSLWHYQYYTSSDFTLVEVFLFIQFMFYVLLPIMYCCKQKLDVKKYLMLPMIYAVPLVVFAIQAYLLDYQVMALAITAVALGLLYLGLWITVRQIAKPGTAFLSHSYLMIGLFFLTIACPLALNGSLSQTILAIEGLVLIFVGNRFQRNSSLIPGILLVIVSGIHFVVFSGVPDWYNTNLKTGLILGVVYVASAYLLAFNKPNHRPWQKIIAYCLFISGLMFWYGVQYIDIRTHINIQFAPMACLLSLSATALIGMVTNRWLKWTLLRSTLVILLAGMVALTFQLCFQSGFPAYYLLSWVFAFVIAFTGIYQIRQKSAVNCQILLTWLLTAVLVKLLSVHLPDGLTCLAYGLAPAIMLAATWTFSQVGWWPVKDNNRNYKAGFVFPMVVALAAWMLAVNSFNPTTLLPWHYLPILNPIDLACVAVLLVSGLWLYSINQISHSYRAAPMVGGFMFISMYWMTFVVIRSLHLWAQVPFYLPALIASTLTQLCLTVLWGSVALAAIISATIKGWRPAWFSGVVILGLVIVKLLFLDLSNLNTLFRIFTFIGVGLLLLLIGYISPLPPRKTQAKLTA